LEASLDHLLVTPPSHFRIQKGKGHDYEFTGNGGIMTALKYSYGNQPSRQILAQLEDLQNCTDRAMVITSENSPGIAEMVCISYLFKSLEFIKKTVIKRVTLFHLKESPGHSTWAYS
jgi:hypothetical protein